MTVIFLGEPYGSPATTQIINQIQLIQHKICQQTMDMFTPDVFSGVGQVITFISDLTISNNIAIRN